METTTQDDLLSISARVYLRNRSATLHLIQAVTWSQRTETILLPIWLVSDLAEAARRSHKHTNSLTQAYGIGPKTVEDLRDMLREDGLL